MYFFNSGSESGQARDMCLHSVMRHRKKLKLLCCCDTGHFPVSLSSQFSYARTPPASNHHPSPERVSSVFLSSHHIIRPSSHPSFCFCPHFHAPPPASFPAHPPFTVPRSFPFPSCVLLFWRMIGPCRLFPQLAALAPVFPQRAEPSVCSTLPNI